MHIMLGLLGGIGLFLLGMMLMTDGLKAMAGEALKNQLTRFTGGTIKSITSGAVVTGLVQSSSATTLMTIGFVSAGLISFSQSIGVILGANLGTTSTSWLISLIGFKIDIAALSLPLIGIGVLLKQFSRHRWAHFGMIIAGFGLIFVGIEWLQDAMSGIAANFDFSRFGSDSISGRLLLTAIGIVMTILMQSSTAAVAATLTAIHTGAIDFHQAAALVIGQNIGTTATAIIAGIGATVAAKRSVAVHILFNLGVGLMALLVFPLFIGGTLWVARQLDLNDSALMLAFFHTVFNLAGILVFAPLIQPFSSIIIRLIPEKKPAVTRYLDPSLKTVPSVAFEAARRSLQLAASQALLSISHRLMQDINVSSNAKQMEELSLAIDDIKAFLAGLSTSASDLPYDREHISIMHALDHLERMIRASGDPDASLPAEAITRPIRHAIADKMQACGQLLTEGLPETKLPQVDELSQDVAQWRKVERLSILEQTAKGSITPQEATKKIHNLLWLDRITYHFWRLMHHLDRQTDYQTLAEAEADILQSAEN